MYVTVLPVVNVDSRLAVKLVACNVLPVHQKR
jgi:hypothetical protein